MKNFIRKVAVFELLIFVIMIIIQSNIIRGEEIYKINFQKINVKDGLSNRNITTIYQDSRGYIWIGTANGLNRYNGHEISIYSNEIGNEKSLSSNYISSIIEDDYGNMWIGTTGGLHILDLEKNEITRISNKISDNEGTIHFNITALYKDSKGRIWIGTENGLYVYDFSSRKISSYTIDGESGHKLNNNYITAIEEDDYGVIWIGTDNGINIIESTQGFNLLDVEKLSSREIENLSVTDAVVDSDNDFWIGTKYDGLIRITSPSKDVLVYRENEETGILSNNIKSILEIRKGIIIVATGNGISVINKDTGSIENFVLIDGIDVNVLFQDENIVWLGTSNGLISYCIDTKEVKSYKKEFKEKGLKDFNVSDICQDTNNKDILWIGEKFIGGLIKFNKKSGIEKVYMNNEENIYHGGMNGLKFDGYGNVWIGTEVGLIKFDTKNEKFYSYTEKDGLIDNYIYSLLLDSDDNVWIATGKGISKLNIKSGVFNNYIEGKEINVGGFNIGSARGYKDGLMCFGANKGVLFFNPKEVVGHSAIRNNVVIEDILVNNKDSYNGKDELKLSYRDNNIEIKFFIPGYQSISDIKYDYMLEGLDKDWICGTSKHSIRYTLLSPGKYNFKIRATDVHGNISDETTIKIIIKAPIWKTPLAYIIYVFVFLSIIIYIRNYVTILEKMVKKRTSQLNKQLENNKKLYKKIIKNEKFRNIYFVNLSHELRTPLNVILSTTQLLSFLNKSEDIKKDKFNEYIKIIDRSSNILLKVISDILDSSKIESGNYKINKKDVDIVYIVEETALNMSKFIEEKGIKLIIDPEIEEKIVCCDPTEIERCMINLLANATKFTPKGGKISVFIKDRGNEVDIIVKDTGIGISEEDQNFIFNRFSQVEDVDMVKYSSSGIGLTLVKCLVELHGGSITLESEINKGSKFTITLPS